MHKKGAMYYYVSSNDGKRVWTKLSSSYAEALAMWAKLEGAAAQDNSVGAAIDRFLAEVLPSYSDKTRKEWPRMTGLLRAVFGEMSLDEVRPHHIARYLDERPAKVAANREIGLMSTIYSYAMRWGLCDNNPCRGVRRNREKARTRYITDDEFLAIRERANPQWQCIMDIAYLTALRKGDILRLRLSDIQDNLLVVQTSKTGKKQSFEITQDLRAVLDRAKGLRRRIGSMYLFCTQDGQPYSENGSLWAWKRLCIRAGVEDAHFHDIRAKSLTDAARAAGRDYAQALAGHADGSMTEVYVRARDTQIVKPLGGIVERKELWSRVVYQDLLT
jgi:integrase